MRKTSISVFTPVFENDFGIAYTPEQWAQEALLVLQANMVAANLVYRDFENTIASYGQVVNCRRPGTFEAVRKGVNDDVTVQDADATNLPVTLNQHLHTSFIIKDADQSMAFRDLVTEYLTPAVQSLSNALDQIVLVQTYRFLANHVGSLGTAASKATVIAAREKLNSNKAPMQGRNVIVTPNVEADLLNVADFVNAEKVGDAGTALREGSLGRKFGLDFYMAQNAPSIPVGNDIVTTTIDAAAAAGATSINLASGANVVAGGWLTVAGDMTPQLVTVAPTTAGVTTISPGLTSACDSGAAVTFYTPAAINLSAGYDAGWVKAMTINGITQAPYPGQMISFLTNGTKFGAIGTPTATSLTIDRPTAVTVANTNKVGIGPKGEYCLAFHRNAIALVTRPLATPKAGAGALSAVANDNGLAVRVVIAYDPYKQGHLVTVDLLCGIEVLDTNLGCVILA